MQRAVAADDAVPLRWLVAAHAAHPQDAAAPHREWEEEHPLEVIRETGVNDVFLAGWRGHKDLPHGLNAADVVVLPSVHEQFGQVLVEGMACGLPVIAVNAHGS